jgi:hypothetical protein
MTYGSSVAQRLPIDLRVAANIMADTNTFPTGQGIMRDAATRIEQLELQAVGFRESLRKAALDSEHGHEILDLCWNSYFPEMPKETNK